MVEFVSKLEEIVPAEELNLPPSPGFGKYKKIMPREAVAHPAKFNTNLVEFLIERYTKPGDVVLDPMAGSGVLGVIAALKGRNAVQVELEEKFFEWMEKARENVEKYPTLSEKGLIINICGDARRLSDLIRQADVCITSPPYADALSIKADPEGERRRLLEKFRRGEVEGAMQSGLFGAISRAPQTSSMIDNTLRGERILVTSLSGAWMMVRGRPISRLC
jgi:DNA modification methylase